MEEKGKQNYKNNTQIIEGFSNKRSKNKSKKIRNHTKQNKNTNECIFYYNNKKKVEIK